MVKSRTESSRHNFLVSARECVLAKEPPRPSPSLRLVMYYASKNKKSGLALISLQIDDAIPSYACTLQLRLIGLVGMGAGV